MIVVDINLLVNGRKSIDRTRIETENAAVARSCRVGIWVVVYMRPIKGYCGVEVIALRWAEVGLVVMNEGQLFFSWQWRTSLVLCTC